MGRKPIVSQFNMFATGSMGADNTSLISNLETSDQATIHLTWTAGPVGEFFLDARNGAKQSTANGTGAGSHGRASVDDAWFEVDLGAFMTVTGADSELQIVLTQAPGTEIRLRWVRASGTASDLKALLSTKVVGS